MYNKNKIRIIILAKKISYACIDFFVATFIISIVTAFFVSYVENNLHSVLQIYPPIDYSKPMREYFFKVLFPSMIISSIFGIIFFTFINFILSKRLKIFDSAFREKEIKQNLDSFKFQRILNNREFKDLYFNSYSPYYRGR